MIKYFQKSVDLFVDLKTVRCSSFDHVEEKKLLINSNIK